MTIYASGLNNIELFIPAPTDISVDFIQHGEVFTFPATKPSFFLRDGQRVLKMSFFFRGYKELTQLVGFYHRVMGKYKKFWIPSFINEFVLTRDIPPLGSFCYVKNNNFKARSKKKERVFIWLKNNDWIIRKVVNAESESEEEERISFDIPTPNFRIKVDDVFCFGFLLLVRFDTPLQIKAVRDEAVATTELSMVELIHELP